MSFVPGTIIANTLLEILAECKKIITRASLERKSLIKAKEMSHG